MLKRSALAGIDLNAPESVHRSKKANFRFYGAPCGLFILQDASLGEWSILDAGMFIQSLMLAAHAKGLATVPQAFLTDYAKEIKIFLGIPDTKRLLLGISLGYSGAPVDALPPRPERVVLDELLTFVDE
jgi:nitroreductase